MNELHILAYLNAKPGREDALRELVLTLVAPSRAEAGCRRYIPYELGQKGRFVFDEIWESEAALDLHAQTPHFQRAAALFPELLEGTLVIEVLHEVV